MKVTIEFKQTVTYEKEVEMDEDSFLNLQDWEGNIVSETSDIDVFGRLSNLAMPENISEAEQRFELINVTDSDE